MTGDIIIAQQQMNEFITNAFNYFNGRINIFNKARLIINWCNMESSCTGGLTTNPNTVIIYPNVILRFSNNKYDFLVKLISVIIHELYHVDQFIIYDLMIYDKSYHDAIENSVEINSISYLYNHINEINKALNLDIVLCNEEVNEYMCQYYINQSVYYHRKKYAEHLISVFMDMVSLSEYESIKDGVLALMNNPESLIKISINGNELIVKDKAYLQDINILNDYLYYNYYYKGYMVNKSFEVVQCENGVCFTLNCKTKYYIGTVVK